MASLREALGAKGLLCYGMSFGLILAVGRGLGRNVARKAADIEVAEKTETKVVPYLENIPKAIMDKKTLDKLLTTLPKEQWENPPETSYLYILKQYAETYGEGKATKMGWWDFWYMRINAPVADEFLSGDEVAAIYEQFRTESLTGEIPLLIPGPPIFIDTGRKFKFRGAEPFAGDQVRSPITDAPLAQWYLNNLAWYREGLAPWRRGLEIGMAHGYFIIGPFINLGPLRDTPEAATVGLVAGVALIGIASVGGLIFGSTIKPTFFDKEGQTPGEGFQELINWHALGGIGGAGFAHALLTFFAS